MDHRSTEELFAAVELDDYAVIISLAENGAKLNSPDYSSLWQYTPLISAVRLGSMNAIKALLAAGADINTKDKMGFTPLMHAAWFDRKEIVLFLLEAGAAMEVKNEFGNTVLSETAQIGNMEMTRLLLERGADPNTRNKNKMTPHDLAKNPEIRLMLSKRHKYGFIKKLASFFLSSPLE
jgi:ankyrin repeat protein